MFENHLKLLQTQILSVFSSAAWLDILEILLIAAAVFIFYIKFIRNTQSGKLVRGLLFLFAGWILGEVLIMLNLMILGMFIKALAALVSLSLIVIFQPELRRLLGYLGQPGFIGRAFFNAQVLTDNENTDVIKELIEAVKYFTKTRTGALIVLQNELNPCIYSEVGTKLNADVSAELILTVFYPNTPLHDGAMVIKGNKILSAGVLLPLTEDPKLSWKYGTRHRAAIGITEISDCACLVVSEETGDVSVSMDGTLKKYDDLITLKSDLMKILNINQDNGNKKSILFKFSNMLKKQGHKE